jgi:hypothetical protein
MGDSYNGSGGAGGDYNEGGLKHGQPRFPGRQIQTLKPKDLCGIPWRLALALQQPYYTGRIRDEKDRIWLAAMIDTEGCMFIHKRKAGQSNGQGYYRKSDNYGPGLEVANTSEEIVKRCLQITGIGSICSQSPEQNRRRKQTIFRWNLRTTECRDVVREVYPYLVAKQHEARILCGCPPSGKQAEAAHEALKGLHNGVLTDVDFPAPESMFEPGWYLRSEIIWAKKNCMPESVRDRPTRSHETVFLLTKAARYFYDQDAVREAQTSFNTHFRSGTYTEGRAARGQAEPGRDILGERNSLGRNLRSVWTIATEPFPEAHFATFPTKLVAPCLKAGCPHKVCAECGAPWVREVEKSTKYEGYADGREIADDGKWSREDRAQGRTSGNVGIKAGPVVSTRTLGFLPTCECHPSGLVPVDMMRTRPGIVIDPFMGSGTVGLMAERHRRRWAGCDISADYAAMAEARIDKERQQLQMPLEVG